MDKYELKHPSCPLPVGYMAINFDKDTWEWNDNLNYTGELPWFLVFLKHPKNTKSVSELLRMWVLGRALDPNNILIERTMKTAGLKRFCAYGFFKYNKGRYITDKFYCVDIGVENE